MVIRKAVGSTRGRQLVQTREIASGGLLENAQVEMPRSGQQVVEDLGLDALVLLPAGRARKDIQFDRQSGRGRFQRVDQERHTL